MATKTWISVEEYDSLPEAENGVEYELSEGELVVVPSPMLFHNRIRDEVLERFRVFLRQNPQIGEVTSETNCWLTPKTARRPDVAFIAASKLLSLDPRKKIPFAPDVAIEIASPDDDLPRKIPEYLRAGARVWAIYPDARIARIHKPGEKAQVLDADANGIPDDPELLPGLTIPLADIFNAA